MATSLLGNICCCLSLWVTVRALLKFWQSDLPFHRLYYCQGIVAYGRHWFAVPSGFGRANAWLLACV